VTTPTFKPRRPRRRRTSTGPSPSPDVPSRGTSARLAASPVADHGLVPIEPGTEPLEFEAIGFDHALLLGIRDRGFTHTTPIQTAVLPLVRAGHDVIACAETGTGKTAAFVLPILQRLMRQNAERETAIAGGTEIAPLGTRVLVLTPTRELAVQIDDDVQGFGYHAGLSSMAVYGGAPMEPQTRALTAGVAMVVATPGRLMDHMKTGTTAFGGLDVLVIDEADRMLDMGFWPDVRRIVSQLPTERQTLMFSATMPDEIMGFAKAIMRDPVFLQVGERGAAARTITHSVEMVATADKTDWLVTFLKGDVGPVLVFVKTKRGADRLARELVRRGLQTVALHADRLPRERMTAVEGFKSGRYPVMVATDIAARGLDFDGITHVVNYDIPRSPDAYVHRAGRTGRALATGIAVTLVAPGEERAMRAMSSRLPTRD
jgi:ATP-dependent RNA helicase RhlE